MDNETLLVAGQNQEPEIFYTLEGEGCYAGYPSVFLRLSKCNLTCLGFASKDSPHGCDSYPSWSQVNKMTFKEIVDIFEARGYDKYLRDGAVLKITGGEPLLQAKQLIKFFEYLETRWGKFGVDIDFETNGTIAPPKEFSNYFISYTVSPKLACNGDSLYARYKPAVLKYFMDNEAAIFKFVVRNESDVTEIIENYVDDENGINADKQKIWLMPCCGSREELIAESEKVGELCKKYGFKFSPRLQLLLWNKALRV